MIDGASIAILVTALGTLLLNVFQSIKSNHFRITCFGCCELTSDLEGQRPITQ